MGAGQSQPVAVAGLNVDAVPPQSPLLPNPAWLSPGFRESEAPERTAGLRPGIVCPYRARGPGAACPELPRFLRNLGWVLRTAKAIRVPDTPLWPGGRVGVSGGR